MKKTFLLASAVLAVALLAMNASAAEAKKIIPISEAEAIAVEEVPGEVIKVELERGTYEVKIRAEKGGVMKVYVDARDGEIKKTKKEHDHDEDDD